jgi:hypothetical protein
MNGPILFMHEAFFPHSEDPQLLELPFVSRGFESPAVVYGNVMGEHYCFCHPMTLKYTGGHPLPPPGMERVNETPNTGNGTVIAERRFHDETQPM